MATTNIAPQAVPGPYVTLQPSATTLDTVLTAADVGQHNSFVSTGNEILFAINTEAVTTRHITFYSVVDPFNRTGDITAYALLAGVCVHFSFKDPNGLRGWKQTGAGNIVEFSGDSVNVKFAILSAP